MSLGTILLDNINYKNRGPDEKIKEGLERLQKSLTSQIFEKSIEPKYFIYPGILLECFKDRRQFWDSIMETWAEQNELTIWYEWQRNFFGKPWIVITVTPKL